jgi:hypothetical protein
MYIVCSMIVNFYRKLFIGFKGFNTFIPCVDFSLVTQLEDLFKLIWLTIIIVIVIWLVIAIAIWFHYYLVKT